MVRTICFVLFISLISAGCASKQRDPQKIIDKAVAKHGGDRLSNSTVEFDFRDRHYIARRNKGTFSYERIFKEQDDTVHDYLTNDGFFREVNGVRVEVPDTMAAKYSRSVNSTIYFASLPYGLNDAAVKKKFLDETIIDDQPYYRIEITFEEEGGGEDHNDVFHYWIHQRDFTMDYFSYRYYTEGGGMRFRKAVKQHAVKGIILQDYVNYKPASSQISFDDLMSLYQANALEELSMIELKNVEVK